jgi:vacuolar-type H+-ATPase catalytic subunit A/Vma1
MLVDRLGVKGKLASISLNQEDSLKELEGVQKMARRQTLPSTLKKAKNKRTSISNCSLFIEIFHKLSKQTPYMSQGKLIIFALFHPIDIWVKR